MTERISLDQHDANSISINNTGSGIWMCVSTDTTTVILSHLTTDHLRRIAFACSTMAEDIERATTTEKAA